MKTQKRFVITDMFKHHNILGFFLTLAITFLGLSGPISTPSHAELIDNGGGLIYDTVLDITWAQPEPTSPPPGGFRTWDDANTWAADLMLGGVSGWRLPYASVAAGVGPLLDLPVDCTLADEADCRDNEMGYMFYYNLSGTFEEPITGSGDPDLALFPDLSTLAPYWTGTRRNTDSVPEPIPDTAWLFNFLVGEWRNSEMVRELKLTWAVHDGNVVSEPPGDLPPKVITDGNGNVTRIENLLVLDEIGVTKLYNVDFDYDSAINVYPAGEFDFPASADALAASLAVRDALNAEDTIPPGASSEGTDQFFIGSLDVQFGIVLAVGSENLTGFWDDCETECFGSVAALDPDDPFTYAKFTETQDEPPGPATLISPSGAIIENIPTYTWNAVADSTWYYLTVKDDTGEVIIGKEFTASGAGCSDGTGECSVTLEVELADGLYQWLIQTYNENGEGPLSDEKFFTVDTTGEKPGIATLIAPSGDITNNTPTYTWDAVANAAQYQLFVWDSTETTVINQWYTAEEAGCSDTTVQCSLTPETVLADDSHEWWIRTENGNGRGVWSVELSFTVDTSVPPGSATLISPSGAITDNTPTYTWNAVADSTWYQLFVWDNTEMTVIDEWYTAEEAGCSDGTGECSLTPETVLADDSHEWWIRTWNKSGYGPWSPSATVGVSFTVDTSIGTEVILDAAGNVIQILNLLIADEFGEDTLYNVDFFYSTAFDIYGEILDFDFTEEDVFPALAAVNKALNDNEPTPVGAGPQGSNQFFIGADEENDLVEGVGGEIIEGVWNECETDCSAGVTLLAPIFPYTYAVFTELDLD